MVDPRFLAVFFGKESSSGLLKPHLFGATSPLTIVIRCE